MFPPTSRREFLKMLAALGGATLLGGCSGNSGPSWSGKLLGPSWQAGHRLRHIKDKPPETFPEPTASRSVDVAIIGGGIAGLSAGWWLQREGMDSFELYEMEPDVGGNSRSGQNEVSAYPWGAHYLPLPSEEAEDVRLLLEDLKVITGYDSDNKPQYDSMYLCHAPHERLLKDGQWQEGLVPKRGVPAEDMDKIGRFFDWVQTLKAAKGRDGRRAFVIPLAYSSQDQSFRNLDNISMRIWLDREDLRCPTLDWYINYCCRDDYGALFDQVSAWAGLHYFAARSGEGANAESGSVLTWPEGNGWIVKQLSQKLEEHIHTGEMAYQITPKDDEVAIHMWNPTTQKTTLVLAQYAICALPRFIAAHLLPDWQSKPPAYLSRLAYAPWLVANITLNKLPEGSGSALAWDNVSYYSPSLGYVVATHQNIKVHQGKTVVTYYYPLTDGDPKTIRQEAVEKTYAHWNKLIVEDFAKMHPGIEKDIESLDVWVWGHGMIQPGIRWLWGKGRQAMMKPFGRLHFAHSDMSGISIFEEAQYHGLKAARSILWQLR